MTFSKNAEKIRMLSVSGLSKTMRKATSSLAIKGIPSLVIGGYAVQEHGYAYSTDDVDIIVPDIDEAREVLSISGFRVAAGTRTILYDRETKVEVNLLPGGGSVGPGPLKLPIPTTIKKDPIIDLRRLIETKLSSFIGNKGKRFKDLTAVQELIKVNELPIDYVLLPEVKEIYTKLWNITYL